MDIDLDRLEALLKAATPGPWVIEHPDEVVGDAAGVQVAAFDGPGDPWIVAEAVAGIIGRDGNDPKHDNAALIAAMHEALPRLLAIAEAVEKMHAAHDRYGCGFYDDGEWGEAYDLTRTLVACPVGGSS